MALPACKEAPSAHDETVAELATPPRQPEKTPLVNDDAGQHVLRYFSPTTGKLILARRVSEVPEGARSQVIVVPNDPSMQGPWLFVADLINKTGDSYPVRVVDRFELEKRVASVRPKPAPQQPATASGDDEVILYKTAWCGYCTKAAEYLRLKGVPFVERDLEREADARQDMMDRARRAGFPVSRLQGVPILYVKGTMLTGFNRDAIDAAL
ncbi:MAG: glutaredoxin domain-containing protein [Myxococcota bacterium]|nr:glutaredoxin domain-containing protein [Myxococcota bacterium]